MDLFIILFVGNNSYNKHICIYEKACNEIFLCINQWIFNNLDPKRAFAHLTCDYVLAPYSIV